MTRRTGRHASFNPRARTGRDRCCTSALRLAPCFNPRARVGRDGAPDQPEAVTLGFNPRARVGRDDAAAWRSKVSSMFQSTRPRGARQSHRRRWCRAAFVSIHAPARGATRDGQVRDSVHGVSIHAPAWGATTAPALERHLGVVSIHAPAWGATTSPRSRSCRRSFNPRARVGRDACITSIAFTMLSFQSTRPRGARLSTSYTGLQSFVVSIHAPARGATPCPPGTPRCP